MTTPQTTWDIAHTFGHLAFKCLASAQKNFEKYKNIKQEEKSLGKNVWDENIGWTNVDLSIIHKIELVKKDYFESISCSIVLFQVMMEAIINDVIKKQPILHTVKDTEFGLKWKNSLNAVKKTQYNIDQYLDRVYRPCRNTIIHPTQTKLDKQNLQDLKILNFNTIHDNIRFGWRAYEELFDGLGIPHTKNSYQNESWETMCEVNDVKIN